jgi:hypothetical protein
MSIKCTCVKDHKHKKDCPDYPWTQGRTIHSKTPSGDVYIGYDEAGQQLYQSNAYEETKTSLINYAKSL